MPEPLAEVLLEVAALLADTDQLIRAVGSGKQRGHDAPQRAQVRPVALARGVGLQVVRGEHPPVTATHRTTDGMRAAAAALAAEPFGNWHLETTTEIIQVRVTKRGEAQVHRQATSRRQNIAPSGHDRVKQRLIDPDDRLFTVLGAGADKRRQVDAFLRGSERVIEDVLRRRTGQQITMVDIGCGNAYLTCALHRFVSDRHDGPVRTIGIEQRADLVAKSTAVAREAGLVGLEFCAMDAAAADPAVWAAPAVSDGADCAAADMAPTEEVPARPAGVDVVVALHACDTATDEALAVALRWAAPVILAAPCCHQDVGRQLRTQLQRSGDRVRRGEHRSAVSGRRGVLGDQAGEEVADATMVFPPGAGAVVAHGILRERWADVLTDAVRAHLLDQCGYRVDVMEFVDSRHTPRNALIRAVLEPAASSPDTATVVLPELAVQWGVTPALWELLQR